ncbi:hypothetical protein C8R47DRAFT_1064295 [Mycena vitilis]|nr:hypothetical protein C8R47DRAFT_1064295 [Mycena vitilis]
MFNLKLAALVATTAVSATAMSLSVSPRQQGGMLYACDGLCFTGTCGNISFVDGACQLMNLTDSSARLLSWKEPTNWSCTMFANTTVCDTAKFNVHDVQETLPFEHIQSFQCRYNASKTALPTSSAVCYTDYGTVTPTIPPSTSTTGSVLWAGRRSMGYMDIGSEGESDLTQE